jgi:hypothetical protein
MCIPRDEQVSVLLKSGKVLLAGGVTGTMQHELNSAELYDPRSGTFGWTGSMTLPRRSYPSAPHATLLEDGRVLITGGTAGDFAGIADLYDPNTGTFSRTGHMNFPREAFTATLLKDGRVLIAGGMKSSTGPSRIGPLGSREEMAAVAEIYEPKTGTFELTGEMRQPRVNHAAVLLRDGRVLVVGGGPYPLNNQGGYVAGAELYDPASGTFSPTVSMQLVDPFPLALKDGRVLVAEPINNMHMPPRVILEMYDPANFTFGTPIEMPELMRVAVALGDGKVLLAVSQNTAAAELFDPQSLKFTKSAEMLYPCPGYETLLANGDVLFTGGWNCPAPTRPSRPGPPMVGMGIYTDAYPIREPIDQAEVFHEKTH